ncbi:MAG: ABC transporter permease [Planctomycetaceae bacterium]
MNTISQPPALSQPRFWLTVWTLTLRELVRFFRQRTRVVGALGQPIIFWVLFGAGLHGSFTPPKWAVADMSYQAYFFPGIAVLIVLFTAIFSTISIIEDRREGFLQGVLVAPISRTSLVFGKLTGGTVLALIQALLFVGIGPLLHALNLAPPLEFELSPGRLLAVAAYLTMLAFALTALGYCIAWPLDSTQGFHAIMSVFLLPMWMLSGAIFPGENSGWLSIIMKINPLTYGVAGLRRIMQPEAILADSASLPSLSMCLICTGLFGVACIALAVLLTQRRSSPDAR